MGIEQGFFLPCFVLFGSFWFSFNFQFFWFFFSMFSDYRRDTMCRNLFLVFFSMFSSYESDTMCMNFFWSLHCVFFQQRNTKCKNENWVFFLYIYIYIVVGFGGAIIFLGISLLCFLVVANRGVQFFIFSYSIVAKKNW